MFELQPLNHTAMPWTTQGPQGSTWCQPGVSLGSAWGQLGVGLESTWGQLGSTCTALPMMAACSSHFFRHARSNSSTASTLRKGH
jgi:hypothetical protein